MKVDLDRDIEALVDAWRRQRCLTRAEAVRRLLILGMRRSGRRSRVDPELIASLA
jgi:hypothetical protein